MNKTARDVMQRVYPRRRYITAKSPGNEGKLTTYFRTRQMSFWRNNARSLPLQIRLFKLLIDAIQIDYPQQGGINRKDAKKKRSHLSLNKKIKQ